MSAAISPARSRADIRRDIESALKDVATARLSDRQIAKVVGCSPTTVGNVRKKLSASKHSIGIPTDPKEVVEMPIGRIKPSPENKKLYRPVSPNDPEVKALADSLDTYGQKEPIIVTRDGYIISGHRRHCAAKLAGFSTVLARVEKYRRRDDINHHIAMLRECNRQRDKSNDEKLREEIVTVDPEEAYVSLISHRTEQSEVYPASMDLGVARGRSAISQAKRAFADEIVSVVYRFKDYWPLSDRRVFYELLNTRPLRNMNLPKSRFSNNNASYDDLTDMLTRLRLTVGGQPPRIPLHAIGDETRPVTQWDVHPDPSAFVRKSVDGFLKGYWRNLMVSQPNHIEVVAEKNTVKTIIEKIAMRYTIPVTTGRGYSSLAPRHAMATRFRRSGKDKLIILVVSDADPEGMDIATSFGRSMRDDFGIVAVEVYKVALTPEQARGLALPENMTAKLSSSRAKGYIERYGEHVWELEALPPEKLQDMLGDAIDTVLDIDAFNQELDAERTDATWLEGVRRSVHKEILDSIG